MSVKITGVSAGSPAARARLRPGGELTAINGHLIHDVLDYRFYMMESVLRLDVAPAGGGVRRVRVRKGEYEELGLEFETYLMDRKHSCRNKCIFCFVDQTPPGMRETLYFKDDDERLSFLFGSYITLTNLSDEEIGRIVRMHISPINVSVHTMNPELRVKMMGNPSAGRVLGALRTLADGGIALNTQLVLCPGINDGDELRRSLDELERLFPAVQSIAAVPVGLTRFRDGLYPLRPYTPEEARQVIDAVHAYAERWERERGERIAYPADEFFLLAGMELPGNEYYGAYPQLENGVGLLTLLEEEFRAALDDTVPAARLGREVSVATGEAAYPLLSRLMREAERRLGIRVHVYCVYNEFFGRTVTVAGLLTGQDLSAQLRGRELGEELLLPAVTLRHERDRFLDDVTIEQLEAALGVPVRLVENSGEALLAALCGG